MFSSKTELGGKTLEKVFPMERVKVCIKRNSLPMERVELLFEVYVFSVGSYYILNLKKLSHLRMIR